MMGVCMRYAQDSMEAEDMLQDGFIKVFQYINQFKFEGSFEGWIRRIIVNTAIRPQKRAHAVVLPILPLTVVLSAVFSNINSFTMVFTFVPNSLI